MRSWELLAGAGEQKCKVCKYVDCTFTCTYTYSSQDETDGLLVILFIVIVPRPVKYVVWCHVQLQIGGRAEGPARLWVWVWVVRESLVGLCVYLGGNQKRFRGGWGRDQTNRGGPRIAWPVLGTCTFDVCSSVARFITFLSYCVFLFFLFSDHFQCSPHHAWVSIISP